MKYSIITVTRNSNCIFDLGMDLYSCFDFEKNDDVKWFVIDNCSNSEFKVELLNFLREMNLSTKFIPRQNNDLFTRSSNIGLMEASKYLTDTQEHYYVLLNPDIRFLNGENPIPKIISEMKSNGADLAAPRLLYPDKQTLEFCGARGNSHIGYGMKDDEKDCSILFDPDIEWLTGAFLVISNKALTELGLLDSSEYTHWCSDQEYCRRAVMCGFRVMLSSARAIHDQGKSVSYNPHEEVRKDLPDGLIPNIKPFSLEHIIETATRNSKNKIVVI